jgi:broad specificity phosphatase PhoE
MKIYFIRHGEAIDDVESRYGGWADFPLSSVGISQAKNTAQKLAEQKIDATIIYTSPLRRAIQTAKILGDELNLEVKICAYLKERNTYGLLSGFKKEEAEKHYPWLVKAYQQNSPIDGYEPYQDFVQRVKKLIDLLEKRPHQKVICTTHGKLLKALVNEFTAREATDFADNCVVELELKNGKITLLNAEGVEFA